MACDLVTRWLAMEVRRLRREMNELKGLLGAGAGETGTTTKDESGKSEIAAELKAEKKVRFQEVAEVIGPEREQFVEVLKASEAQSNLELKGKEKNVQTSETRREAESVVVTRVPGPMIVKGLVDAKRPRKSIAQVEKEVVLPSELMCTELNAAGPVWATADGMTAELMEKVILGKAATLIMATQATVVQQVIDTMKGPVRDLADRLEKLETHRMGRYEAKLEKLKDLLQDVQDCMITG